MAEIQIPGVDFAELAREAVAHQITKSMVGADDMVNKIVASALARKVNDKGIIGQYSSENTIPFVVWMAEDMIRASVRTVLVSKLAVMQPQIEREVERSLRACVKDIAKSATATLLKTATESSAWAIKVTVNQRER